MQNTIFDIANVGTMVKLIEKYGLEGRFLLGKPDESWDETLTNLFAVPMGPGLKAWIVPVAANAKEHMGLIAQSTLSPDGVHVNMEYETIHSRMPAHSISFKYDCLVAIQIRGLKRNRQPKCITVTCTESDWDVRLDKELSKLTRVMDKQAPHVQWNLIDDQVTF